MAYMVRYAHYSYLNTPSLVSGEQRQAEVIGPMRPCDFSVVYRQEEYVDGVAVPVRYKTEEEAYEAAPRGFEDMLNTYRVFIEKWCDDRWVQRESCRMDTVYEHVPWANEEWADIPDVENHFPHTANGDPTKLAYTENEAKGELDIQLVTKPGRYLRKFYGDVLSNDDIERWTQKWAAREELEVMFAKTADEIEEVYTSGPHSCMAYSASNYAGHCHPVRVYGDSDLQVAYIKRNDKVTARVLVWPERMVYGRVYGDAGRLKPKLAELGYYGGSLSGAEINRIENRNGPGLIMPYIDFYGSFEDYGTHCTIDGSCSAENTNGLSETGVMCERCEDRVDEDCTTRVLVGGCPETWCDWCANNHAFYCDEIHEMISDSDGVELADGSWVSQPAFDRNGWTCAIGDECYMGTEGMIVTGDGETVHERHIGWGIERCAATDEFWFDKYLEWLTLADGTGVLVRYDHVDQYKADNPELFESAEEREVEAA